MSFESLTSLDDVEDFVEQNELAFLYFTMPNCSVCHGLKPQIEQMLKQYPEIKVAEIDASAVPEAAGQYSIFTAPVLLLFVAGKEYLREARIVHTAQLNEQLARIYEHYSN
ncbi:MAG TPA: thioredoxin family protein [Pseudogracilibacillus sp.]|nr:thioredoxin family protein [Pseudogracilibacillus sp.]